MEASGCIFSRLFCNKVRAEHDKDLLGDVFAFRNFIHTYDMNYLICDTNINADGIAVYLENKIVGKLRLMSKFELNINRNNILQILCTSAFGVLFFNAIDYTGFLVIKSSTRIEVTCDLDDCVMRYHSHAIYSSIEPCMMRFYLKISCDDNQKRLIITEILTTLGKHPLEMNPSHAWHETAHILPFHDRHHKNAPSFLDLINRGFNNFNEEGYMTRVENNTHVFIKYTPCKKFIKVSDTEEASIIGINTIADLSIKHDNVICTFKSKNNYLYTLKDSKNIINSFYSFRNRLYYNEKSIDSNSTTPIESEK